METTNIIDFARRDVMTDALTELLKAGACQRRRKNLPLGRSKSRPFWCARLGACGPHIASTFQGVLAVRPILLRLLFVGFHA
jgi:hypothetical protein